jgi:hypothetical protein
MILKPIPTEFTAQSWDLVAPHLELAMKYSGGDYNLDQIKMMVLMGQWLLIIMVDEQDKVHGACTVSFINYPNHRIAFVTAIGGKLISSEATFKQLCEIVKSRGATKLQGAARKSVARLWSRYGFKERHITVEYKL